MTRLPPGYLVVIDADGCQVAASRRNVGGLSHEEMRAVRRDLEAGMGAGCTVEFVEGRSASD